MNVVTVDQLSHAAAAFLLCVGVLSFLASVIGIWFARASYDCMFLFVSRSPRFRRFDRAMRKVMA
jgi:hypothetical protein